MSSVAFFSDQALGESGAQHGDGLGFSTYARVLATATRETRGPFTIGIYGEWGTGKTSLMRLIEEELAADSRTVTVWFNAWRFEREEHPIIPLVATLVKALESRHVAPTADLRARLIRALRAIAYGFAAKASFGIPGLGTVEASFNAKEAIGHAQYEAPDSVLDRSLYYDAFSSIEAVDLGDALRVVVLVDDLDRCFPDQAIRLLESIKLVLAQQGFIFVLGMARQVLEGYLQNRYEQEYGISEFPGARYLDKIVQMPFDIPPNTGRMRSLAAVLLANQPPEVQEQLGDIAPVAGELSGRNPRTLIRLLNNVLIDSAIGAELGRHGTAQPPLSHFAVSRVLREHSPETFDRLTDSPELCIEVASWDRAQLAELAAGDDDKSRVASTLLANPSLTDLLLGAVGRDWLRSGHLRDTTADLLRGRPQLPPDEATAARVRYDVFFSYTNFDRSLVLTIVQFLASHGLRTFFDAEIRVGSNWRDETDTALTSTRAVCVCVGSQPMGENQTRELAAAVAASHVIIPVLLPGADTAVLPPELRERQWLDLRSGVSEEALMPLLRALRRDE